MRGRSRFSRLASIDPKYLAAGVAAVALTAFYFYKRDIEIALGIGRQGFVGAIPVTIYDGIYDGRPLYCSNITGAEIGSPGCAPNEVRWSLGCVDHNTCKDTPFGICNAEKGNCP